ncbi:ROK family transcriptional regulator [Micromonospora purpureochromogenes]|uniref:ROK family transcriptional regulator n=1 Tax=Micromonospora purpureochromogenes TaxID=47872 RepID=UPI0033E5B815
MASPSRRRAEAARWLTASQVLATLHRRPGITRAAMAAELRLTSGFATEITARLRDLRLLTETPAPARGRGRPTTLLRPHPEGPVVLAVDLRQEDWRHAVATIDGQLREVRHRSHRTREPATVLAAVRDSVEATRNRYGTRLRAVSLAVAGTVHDGHLVQAATLGWRSVDLTTVTAGTDLPLLLGNDATLAGVAEARTGAAVAAGTALHLIVGVGIGGTLTIAGVPVTGAHGAAGEYGHLPFGDREQRCPCGARGCWDLDVDGRGLARHLGESPPADPRRYAGQVLDRCAVDPRARQAVRAVATSLGGGIAGLANLHDPDLITLGGLGPALRHAAADAFDTAYADGLMTLHRARPPSVVDAAHADEGSLRGAAIVGLDHLTGQSAIAEWVRTLATPPGDVAPAVSG